MDKHCVNMTDTYKETSSSFPMETREMFPKIVSQWDVWLSNHPCRWQSAQKRQRENPILKKKNIIEDIHLCPVCSGEEEITSEIRRPPMPPQPQTTRKETRLWAHLAGHSCFLRGKDSTVPTHLFELLPVVVAVPHHHSPQLGRLEELKHLATTHL